MSFDAATENLNAGARDGLEAARVAAAARYVVGAGDPDVAEVACGALRAALELDPRAAGSIPSTKGSL